MLDQLANQGGPGALLFRHFWLVLIVVTVVNGVAAQRRIKPVVDHNPSLADGYQRLFRGYFVWANVPWVLMGIGIVFGGVPTVHHYLLAFDLWMVRVWWVAFGGLLAAGTAWMLIGGGADALARHPGLPHVPRWSAGKLKLFWIGVVLWNVVIGGAIVIGACMLTGIDRS